MRIALLSIGSRGDVQPLVALAAGLKAAGHSPVLATFPFFQDLVEEHGVEFAPLRLDVLAYSTAKAWVESGRNPWGFVRGMGAFLKGSAEQVADDALAVCRGADGVVWTPLALAGPAVAERLGIPAVEARLQPNTPTAEFPPFIAPQLRLGGLANRIGHWWYENSAWLSVRPTANRQRRRLGLPGAGVANPAPMLRSLGLPVLYGYSPLVLPVPRDWPRSHLVTGYWFLDRPASWRPPAELAAFLAGGEPPVGVAFGTMTGFDAEDVLRSSLAAAAVHGRRVVLVGAPPEIAIPEGVLSVESVPHDWLFPRLAAVMHHGGAGTTAAALRAGVPSVVVPFFSDQPFWAQRTSQLGVAAPPVPRKQVTLESLSAALGTVLNDGVMRRRAAELGEGLRSEDGVANAVDVLLRVFGAGRHANQEDIAAS